MSKGVGVIATLAKENPFGVLVIGLSTIWATERCFKYVLYKNKPVIIKKYYLDKQALEQSEQNEQDFILNESSNITTNKN